MNKKSDKLLNNNKILELKLSDGLTNLEDLTRSVANNLDFTTFDILSISRVDEGANYTRQFVHLKADTQTYKFSAAAARIVNESIRKYKMN